MAGPELVSGFIDFPTLLRRHLILGLCSYLHRITAPPRPAWDSAAGATGWRVGGNGKQKKSTNQSKAKETDTPKPWAHCEGWHGGKQCTWWGYTNSMAASDVTCKQCFSLLPAAFLSPNQLIHRRVAAEQLAEQGKHQVKLPSHPTPPPAAS